MSSGSACVPFLFSPVVLFLSVNLGVRTPHSLSYRKVPGLWHDHTLSYSGLFPLPSECIVWFRMIEVAQSLNLDKCTGTIIYNSFLSEHKKLANRIINYSVNHLMVVFLLQREFLNAHPEDGFPSLFLVQEEEGEEEQELAAQPVKLLPFSELPFLLISF